MIKASEAAVWERACAVSELEDDKPFAVELDDVPVALVRAEGEIHAIHDVCSHAQVALSEGEVIDGEIECWLHGSMFELATGRPTCLPATEPVPVYPVKIEGDDVYVAVNEARTVSDLES
jgi:3-phenylpropionate/trans-cinnamate dioxygenase ferredoxin subunit